MQVVTNWTNYSGPQEGRLELASGWHLFQDLEFSLNWIPLKFHSNFDSISVHLKPRGPLILQEGNSIQKKTIQMVEKPKRMQMLLSE